MESKNVQTVPHPLPLQAQIGFCLTIIQIVGRPEGRPGGAMVLGKLPVPGRPTIWMIVGQGPIALAVGAGGLFGHFYSTLSFLSSFSLTLGDGSIYTEILSQG